MLKSICKYCSIITRPFPESSGSSWRRGLAGAVLALMLALCLAGASRAQETDTFSFSLNFTAISS